MSEISNTKMKLQIVWETGDDKNVCASIQTDQFFIIDQGEDWEFIRTTLRELVQDYIDHDGQAHPKWASIDAFRDIEYEEVYDLTTVFELYPEVNVNALARSIGMNQSQLRQYVSGAKFVTKGAAQRIESALRQLAARLSQVSISQPA